MLETRQIGTSYTRALFDINSVNKENRTVDVVFATENPVLRFYWDGNYNEVLVCDPANVRMDRLNSGAAVLDTHMRYTITSQLGVVESARLENKEGRATLRFSKRDDVEKVWQDITDGIIRGISVGYNVYAYTIEENANNTIPTYRATDWEPTEISLVTVPADLKSGVRSEKPESLHNVVITKSNNSNNNTMPENATPAPVAEQRSAPAEQSAATPTPAPVAERSEQQPTDNRASAILQAVRSANLSIEFAQQLIDNPKMTIDGARAAIIDKLAEGQPAAVRSANPGSVVPGADEVDKKRTGMSNAILHRVNPGAARTAQTDPGEFRGMSLIDLSREALTTAGVNTRGMSYREIAQHGLNIGDRQHSTSDFPLILGNTVNRALRAAYELQERTFLPWTRRGIASDFKEMSRVALSDFVALDEVKEGAEYKFGTMGEGAEKYKVAKYGKTIAITWESIVNDDLGAFDRIPAAMAASASQKQGDIIYAILSANAAMADGTALFHANHGNLAGSGTAIDITNLATARAAMRKQKAPKGSAMNIAPKFILVGPDKELEAFQYTSSNYSPAVAGSQNPFAGVLTPIVDPRITGNTWYLAANPSMIDTIEYAFLDGEELFTEQRSGFEVDGLQIKVRMVFGAKAIDHKGLYKNAGA